MQKTKQMIEDFLQQVEQDKALAAEKMKELEEKRVELDAERSEISKAVIRMEHEGKQEAVNKLTKELANRVSEISVLDSKIEAYKEMGNSYEAEAEKVFVVAAKEYNEEYPKTLEQANNKLIKAREELENAKELVRKQENVLSAAESEVSHVKANMRYVLEDRLKEIEKYLPKKINILEVPEAKGHYETETTEQYYPGMLVGSNMNEEKDRVGAKTYGTTNQVYVEDTENYGEGIEGKLTYYYKEVIPKQDAAPRKKSLVDKILGR